MKHSQDPEEAGFSYSRSKITGRGLSSGVIPCLTGNMIYSLIKLGFLEDERVSDSIQWIIKYQRADDGIQYLPTGRVYERYKMCWGKHSCHMGVAKTLKALAAIPENKRSPEISNKLSELAEYFLIHHIYKKSHDLDKVSRPGWLKFGFPLMYQTDILELLSIFSQLKIHDQRLNDALEIVSSKCMKDGKWKLENSYNGKTVVRIESKGDPSKWITLRALMVQKEYALM